MAGGRSALELADFTGGTTDLYINEGQDQVALSQNICLDSDMLPAQRPGSGRLKNSVYTTYGRYAGQTDTISCLKETGSDLFSLEQNNAYVYKKVSTDNTGAFTTVNSGNDIWKSSHNGSGTGTNRANGFVWQDHVIASPDARAYPIKLWRKDGSTVMCRTAGIPKMEVGIEAAGGYDAAPANPIGWFTDVYSRDEFSLNYTGWALSNSPGYTIDLASGAKTTYTYSYLMYITFRHTYTNSDGVTYIDEGGCDTPFWFLSGKKLFVSGGTWGSFNATVRIPAANLLGKVYSKDDLKCVLYIAPEGKTDLYEWHVANYNSFLDYWYISSVGLGTVSPTDEGIRSKSPCYINGGILQNDPPPRCKYSALVGNYAFYGNIESYTYSSSPSSTAYVYSPNSVRQSKSDDPDSCPIQLNIDFPEEVTGIGAAGEKCIVGTKKGIYRIDGRYADDGSGIVIAEPLTKLVGCISHTSMVSVGNDLFFAGDDGFYMTDGVAVRKLSHGFDRTYRSLVTTSATDYAGTSLEIDYTKASKITGVVDKKSQRILWSFIDKAYCMEIRTGKFSIYGPWIVGDGSSDDFLALGTFDDKIVRADEHFYHYQFSDGYYSDPRYDAASGGAPDTWDRQAIIYRLKTAKQFLGSRTLKKWVSSITALFKRTRPNDTYDSHSPTLDVKIISYNDGDKVITECNPIHYTGTRDELLNNAKAGFSNVTTVGESSLVPFTRRFKAPGLRCFTKAVEFTNAYRLVGISDDYESALVSGTAVSLPNYPTYSWPLEGAMDQTAIDYFVAFETDDYQTTYRVTSYSAATLVVASAPGNGTKKWKLYTFSKYQFFSLAGISMLFTPFGSSHETYLLSEQGGNTGDKGEP